MATGAEAKVALREYRAGDLEAMYALDCVCFEPVFRFSRRAMRRFAGAGGAITVIAEAAQEIAGFCIVQMEGDVGYVVTLDVAPAWRRKGVARQLAKEIEVRVRAAGGARMGLHVYAGNSGAIRFYEAGGYEEKGVAKGFYGRGLDGLVYVKDLGSMANPGG